MDGKEIEKINHCSQRKLYKKWLTTPVDEIFIISTYTLSALGDRFKQSDWFAISDYLINPRMGLRGHEGERNNCFSKFQLVGQKCRDKTTFN